ncbi:MAG: helicase C-terminal domain-containing protein [bacterium]|nr:helicase C-terminal domain-containing protein [bacterium]
MNIKEIFAKNGAISQRLENYHYRSQQVEMAEKIKEIIDSKLHLIVEAGTGVGKSLAYLVPFIFWAHKENKKVVISTYTKVLQEQIINQDIPFLKETLGINFSYALCLGGENYLCRRKLYKSETYGLFDSFNEVEEFKRIYEWQKYSKDGFRLELEFEPSWNVWSKVCRESDLCLGKKCIYRKECFYQKARLRQQKADILVINHHLFFANIISGNQILPKYEAVVFDEAHNLEDVATQYLGIEVSNTSLKYLLDNIYNPKSQKGLIRRIKNLEDSSRIKIEKEVDEVRMSSEILFGNILEKFILNERPIRIRERNFVENIIHEPLTRLTSHLYEIYRALEEEEEKKEVEASFKRCQIANDALSVILCQEYADYVYWLEIIQKVKGQRIALHGNPISVSQELNLRVFEETAPIVLTSATLSTNNSFTYIKSRLGLEKCQELLLDSPFNYQEQTLLFLSKGIKSPRDDYSHYKEQVCETISQILDIMQGRTFLLFTSHDMLNYAFERISKDYSNLKHLRQGELPSSKLIDKFKEQNKAVLWGNATFWQGVDVPGKALQCVVITKLPFAVPNDPIVEAHMEYLEKKGINPFWNYQIPRAIILTKQGFGRLIRKKEDKGVVAILDSRIRTKSYGAIFLSSLPKCRRVEDVREINKFMRMKKTVKK